MFELGSRVDPPEPYQNGTVPRGRSELQSGSTFAAYIRKSAGWTVAPCQPNQGRVRRTSHRVRRQVNLACVKAEQFRCPKPRVEVFQSCRVGWGWLAHLFSQQCISHHHVGAFRLAFWASLKFISLATEANRPNRTSFPLVLAHFLSWPQKMNFLLLRPFGQVRFVCVFASGNVRVKSREPTRLCQPGTQTSKLAFRFPFSFCGLPCKQNKPKSTHFFSGLGAGKAQFPRPRPPQSVTFPRSNSRTFRLGPL